MKYNTFQKKLLATPPSIKEAREIQNSLRERVRLTNDSKPIEIIAGIDVGYDLKTGQAKAALVAMRLENLIPIESLVAIVPVEFPYVSGFLSFREAPAIIKALSSMKTKPNLLMFDGQGVAHPRRLGIAAHIGVILDIPTIGVAKSRLCGEYQEPGVMKGDQSDLWDKGELIGTVLRSRNNVRPLFVSPGHKVDFKTAVELVQKCLTRFRLPEPTRLADKLSKFS